MIPNRTVGPLLHSGLVRITEIHRFGLMSVRFHLTCRLITRTSHVGLCDGTYGVILEELEYGRDVVLPSSTLDILKERDSFWHLTMKLSS